MDGMLERATERPVGKVQSQKSDGALAGECLRDTV